MRIVLYGNFVVNYCSEVHHARSLEALGHEVVRLQERTDTTDRVLAESLKSDMLIWIHSHGFNNPGTLSMGDVLDVLKTMGKPTVAYHLDLYMAIPGRWAEYQSSEYMNKIQHFFTVDKLMAEWLNQNTEVKGHYLPPGVLAQECRLDNSLRTNDVIFVGSRGYHSEWPYRGQLIDWLRRTYGRRFRHFGNDGEKVVRGDELTNLYNQTKVVVGDSFVKDFTYPYYWSDRLYETIGRGGFIIFPYIEGLENEFVLTNTGEVPAPSDDVELVTYRFGDFEQLKRLIDYYTSHDAEREAIRARGFRKVMDNYTYQHRWQTIIDTVAAS